MVGADKTMELWRPQVGSKFHLIASWLKQVWMLTEMHLLISVKHILGQFITKPASQLCCPNSWFHQREGLHVVVLCGEQWSICLMVQQLILDKVKSHNSGNRISSKTWKLGQWLWLCWQSSRLQFQRSAVWIQSSAKLYIEFIYC